MRVLISVVACAALGACASPSPQPTVSNTEAPFVVPMDPGQIRCATLTNPAALSEATEWTMGLARAQILSGQREAAPDRAQMATSLTEYCVANTGSTIAAAARALGV